MKPYHLLGAVMALLMTAPAAWADDYVWEDPNSRLTMHYPDGWRLASKKHAEDALTVLSPAYSGRAQCRVRTDVNRDFAYHGYNTPYFNHQFVRNQQFWDNYLRQFSDLVILDSLDGVSPLGAPGRSVVVAYSGLTAQQKVVRRISQIWTGVYHDTAYILDCSSDDTAFNRWMPTFHGIASTLRIDHVLPAYAHFPLNPNDLAWGNPLDPVFSRANYYSGARPLYGSYRYPNTTFRYPNSSGYERVSWNEDTEIYNRNN